MRDTETQNAYGLIVLKALLHRFIDQQGATEKGYENLQQMTEVLCGDGGIIGLDSDGELCLKYDKFDDPIDELLSQFCEEILFKNEARRSR